MHPHTQVILAAWNFCTGQKCPCQFLVQALEAAVRKKWEWEFEFLLCSFTFTQKFTKILNTVHFTQKNIT
jgi:hypothetical protein